MTDPGPSFHFPLRFRVLVHLAFVFALLGATWFSVVMLGEQQAWTDSPGNWAGVPTLYWGMGIVAFLVLVAFWYAILLVRNEVAARVYAIPGDDAAGGDAGPEPGAADAGPTLDQPVTAEPETPPPQS